MNWLLPEHLADALPQEAAHLERLRREILDLFQKRGFELVIPPMLEYLESLLTGAGQDLQLRTCQLADQLSGRTLGIRADMTPQVARIDAHLLNREGVTRLCYCGSTLHARPASLLSSREPLQMGAELYGYAGVEADIEILRLLAAVLKTARLSDYRVDLGHVGLFRALSRAARIEPETEETLFGLLQGKDVPGLAAFCAQLPAESAPYGAALMALPTLYGGIETLDKARAVLPPLPEIGAALTTLARLAAAVPDLPISIDLADLRGYHYHNGVVFAAYAPGLPAAVALGGRYDGVGKSFGRARPATGFSLDLRELARLSPLPKLAGGILAPYSGKDVADSELAAEITRLREAGEIVVELLPDETHDEGLRCERRLVRRDGRWILDRIQVL
ncbi:MAG: ATP phosphoribosyltransferase regulatory subunit [Zoogloeaceae bacterium]|jgi:ATP phosphoribosyltransferase regulatory subunit|nr:ATP phosphoribosyltransferase regulatory subunit [Zoogloeaceae bacterium]